MSVTVSRWLYNAWARSRASRAGERLFAVIECLVYGIGQQDRGLGGAGAQPQGHLAGAAARCPGCHNRAVGLGQVEPRVRHDLRGGPAPLRGVAVGVRAPVPRADGQAGRGLDRGSLAGDLDRPEDDLAQPALDGRHGDGDLRLPAAAVGARGQAALPDLRAPDRGPVGGADHRPGDGAGGGDALHGAGAGRARTQGRVRQAARGAARGWLRAREDRRSRAHARGVDRARQALQARHLGRGRPPGDAPRRAQAPGGLDRDGGGARRRPGRGRDRRLRHAASRRARTAVAGEEEAAARSARAPRGRARRPRRSSRARSRAGDAVHVLGAFCVPGAWAVAGGARAADLLVQLAARRVRALHGPGLADGDRSRAGGAGPVAVDRARARSRRGRTAPRTTTSR